MPLVINMALVVEPPNTWAEVEPGFQEMGLSSLFVYSRSTFMSEALDTSPKIWGDRTTASSDILVEIPYSNGAIA